MCEVAVRIGRLRSEMYALRNAVCPDPDVRDIRDGMAERSHTEFHTLITVCALWTDQL